MPEHLFPDVFCKPDSTALVELVSLDIGRFLVAAGGEEVGVVVDRLCRNDDVDVRGEALIERRDRPPTDEHVRQVSVNNRLQGV